MKSGSLAYLCFFAKKAETPSKKGPKRTGRKEGPKTGNGIWSTETT